MMEPSARPMGASMTPRGRSMPYLPEGGKVAVIQHMLTTTTGIDRTRGVIDALRAAGAKEGDSVVIGDMEFDFVE